LILPYPIPLTPNLHFHHRSFEARLSAASGPIHVAIAQFKSVV
jgi:hypothetical protein